MRFFYIIGVFIFTQCSIYKTKKNTLNHKDKINYKIGYEYLLKKNLIHDSFNISDTLVSRNLKYFTKYLCAKEKLVDMNKLKSLTNSDSDFMLGIRLLEPVRKCIDSIDYYQEQIDKKTSIVYDLSKFLKNQKRFDVNYDDILSFSKQVNNVFTVEVVRSEFNRSLSIFNGYDKGCPKVFYLEVQNDSVTTFYEERVCR